MAPNKRMKHELRAMGATPGLVLYTDDLFLQICCLKMFGWNLPNCLGLLYSSRDQRGYPSFTFRTDNKTGEDSSHSLEDETRRSGSRREKNGNTLGVNLYGRSLTPTGYIKSIYLSFTAHICS